MSNFEPTTQEQEPVRAEPAVYVVAYRLVSGDVARASYSFGQNIDPVLAIQRRVKGTALIEVESIGNDSGGSSERFVNPQAVAAVLITPG